MFTFLKEVQSELHNVTFPTRVEVTRLTAVVIMISLMVGAFIGFSDFLFTKLLELIIK